VLAVMKVKFVSNRECTKRGLQIEKSMIQIDKDAERFMDQIDKDKAESREAISRKLDSICNEIKETRKQYTKVANFLGRVEQYMADHGGGPQRPMRLNDE